MMEFKKDMSLELHAACTRLRDVVKEYYQDPEHRRELEDEYRQKHGKEYIWKNLYECKGTVKTERTA